MKGTRRIDTIEESEFDHVVEVWESSVRAIHHFLMDVVTTGRSALTVRESLIPFCTWS